MRDLFDWMNRERQTLHPLILSAVFHYEFVFIHPFSDGNGRMARLWHTALLYAWKPIFAYIPIESRIEQCQEGYYDAIAACHRDGSSDVFIRFMLRQIDAILDELLSRVADGAENVSDSIDKLLRVMDYGVEYSAAVLMERLHLRSKENFRKQYLHPAIERGLVRRTIPDKPSSKKQKYVRV
jgi:Fic family protein